MKAWQIGCSAAILVIAAGCGSNEEAPSGSTTALTSTDKPAATSEPAPSTSEPAPDLLESTTKDASNPPAGSTGVEMHGPPPQLIPRRYIVKGGPPTVFFIDNTSPAGDSHGGHALAIGPEIGQPVAVSDLILAAHSATFTVKGLEPGRYAIWCDFLDHAALGQNGTLTVR